ETCRADCVIVPRELARLQRPQSALSGALNGASSAKASFGSSGVKAGGQLKKCWWFLE
ncbi:hypothetical protein CEXT_627091, partial [Caerostris extrusa]